MRFGGNTPCVEVRSSTGALVILDAGTGIRSLGHHLAQRDSGEDLITRAPLRIQQSSRKKSISTIPTPELPPINLFLTHRHSDHVVGLAHFSPLLEGACSVLVRSGDAGLADHQGHETAASNAIQNVINAGSGTDVSVARHLRELADFLLALVRPPLFPEVAGLTSRLEAAHWSENEPVSIGDLRVYRHPANHPGGAAIVRINDASGPLVAYAPDNELALDNKQPHHAEWLRSLKAFLKGVPLLVHDAMYTAQELPALRGWGHSSTDEAVQLALDCECSTLALFHHHPDRDDDSVERLVEKARKQVLAHRSKLLVFAASEGLILPL